MLLLLLEPFNATHRVHVLHFSGEEGVAVGADLHTKLGHRRPDVEGIAAGAADLRIVIPLWVNR